jgi:hypothetical protein
MIDAHLDMCRDEAGIGDEQRLFDFEADFAKDLRCIPMVVRFKLDRCGVKLSLRQWSKMGQANRTRLLAMRGDRADEVEQFREAVTSLAKASCGEAIRWLPADPHPVWADATRVPADIATQAATAGVAPPSASCWSRLSTLERFALLKLARSDHDNHNFIPALYELGIAVIAVDRQAPLNDAGRLPRNAATPSR